MGLWGEHYVVRRKQNVRMATNLMELATLIYKTFKLLKNWCSRNETSYRYQLELENSCTYIFAVEYFKKKIFLR